MPITSPVSTTLYITWSKVNTGATGAAGANAVVFSLYAPNGTVFQNQAGSLLIQSAAYEGSTLISSGAAYVWAKFESGSWVTISGQTASSLTVNGSDVPGMASYRCTMTYGGKTYQDIITLIDKTDNYQADVDSTAGDIFKNTVGTTCLICRLWQNGTEVDPLKSTTYSTSAPSSPATGDFYYKITTSTPVTALMRWSGSAWVDVSNDATYKHTRIYSWYRRDNYKDGQGNASHIGWYTGGRYEVVHASSSKGKVAPSTLKNGWTHVGWLKAVDYSADSQKDQGKESSMSETISTATVVAESGDTVRLRVSPDIKSIAIAKVPIGMGVTVLDKSPLWWQINYGGKIGWMLREYLEETHTGTVPDIPAETEIDRMAMLIELRGQLLLGQTIIDALLEAEASEAK